MVSGKVNFVGEREAWLGFEYVEDRKENEWMMDRRKASVDFGPPLCWMHNVNEFFLCAQRYLKKMIFSCSAHGESKQY